MARSGGKTSHDQYQTRRRALLKEAGALLGEQGAEHFSLSTLAERLGITSAALYYYFKNKQDLLFECYRYSFDLADVAYDQAVSEHSDNCPRQLERFVELYMLAALHELQPTMSLRETTDLQSDYAVKIKNLRKRLHGKIRKLISEGIRRKEIAPCDPALTTIAIFGALSDLLRVYNPHGRITPQNLSRQISLQLARGFFVADSNGHAKSLPIKAAS